MTVPVHPRLRQALERDVTYRSLGAARYGYPEMPSRPLEALNLA